MDVFTVFTKMNLRKLRCILKKISLLKVAFIFTTNTRGRADVTYFLKSLNKKTRCELTLVEPHVNVKDKIP